MDSKTKGKGKGDDFLAKKEQELRDVGDELDSLLNAAGGAEEAKGAEEAEEPKESKEAEEPKESKESKEAEEPDGDDAADEETAERIADEFEVDKAMAMDMVKLAKTFPGLEGMNGDALISALRDDPMLIADLKAALRAKSQTGSSGMPDFSGPGLQSGGGMGSAGGPSIGGKPIDFGGAM